MLQIALMGIARGIVGFGISLWYAFEDLVNPFLEAIYSVPFIGSILESIINLFW